MGDAGQRREARRGLDVDAEIAAAPGLGAG